jgi:hypothetical protein
MMEAYGYSDDAKYFMDAASQSLVLFKDTQQAEGGEHCGSRNNI